MIIVTDANGCTNIGNLHRINSWIGGNQQTCSSLGAATIIPNPAQKFCWIQDGYPAMDPMTIGPVKRTLLQLKAH